MFLVMRNIFESDLVHLVTFADKKKIEIQKKSITFLVVNKPFYCRKAIVETRILEKHPLQEGSL